MTSDPLGNVQAIEKLIPKNARFIQTFQTHTLKQSMEALDAVLLQSVNPAIGQNVRVEA